MWGRRIFRDHGVIRAKAHTFRRTRHRYTHHICKTPAYPAGVLKKKGGGDGIRTRGSFHQKLIWRFSGACIRPLCHPSVEDPYCLAVFFLAGFYYITALPPYVVPDVSDPGKTGGTGGILCKEAHPSTHEEEPWTWGFNARPGGPPCPCAPCACRSEAWTSRSRGRSSTA